jgi:hypothetical protein
MKKQIHLLILCFTTLSFALKAQSPLPSAAPVSPAVEESKSGFGIGIKGGTNGFGLEISKGLNKKNTIAARAFGVTSPTFNLTNYEYLFDSTTLLVNASLKLGAVGLLFDFHPFGNAFKITIGGTYLLYDISATANVRDSVKQNKVVLSPKEFGDIKVGLVPQGFAPYIGIGFGRAIPNKRVGFGFDLGTYYMNTPELSFKTTGLIEPTSAEEPKLQENIKDYVWLPQLTFNLTIKLSK